MFRGECDMVRFSGIMKPWLFCCPEARAKLSLTIILTIRIMITEQIIE